MPFSQQRHDHLQRFLEAGGQVIEGIAKGFVFWLMAAGSEAQDEAASADLVERIGHLGKQRRGAKRGAGHEWTKRDARCHCSQCAEHGKSLPGGAFILAWETVYEMVGQPEGIEPDLFCYLRHGLKVAESVGSPFE